jgi:hypothetical protein
MQYNISFCNYLVFLVYVQPIAMQATTTYNETYLLQYRRAIATISYRVAITSKYCNATQIVEIMTTLLQPFYKWLR